MTNESGTAPDFCSLLAISEHKRSGLILCKSYHAEFAGPGAAVSTVVDQYCLGIIAIGSPEIIELQTHEDRRQAYGRRIQWQRWLQRITDHPDPMQRAEKLFSGFEAFFGEQVLIRLPDDVLALLAGVLPQTITTVRSQYRYLRPTSESRVELDSTYPHPSIVALHPITLQNFAGASIPICGSESFVGTFSNLPCSA
ncbi:hypothetical protein K9N68_06185 [Kovacikia minuta CCNUW1]|uniref:hypothetical protein n=1 Tax=Kovacikia minuta TaxID=2931930 RepID=UPI001CCE0BE8|nr:hypothetical protein [Kovacikia minuta]UBF27526.1 hypothetical protein K9N68_06185 [Kovacikia minuta CCNUW1]